MRQREETDTEIVRFTHLGAVAPHKGMQMNEIAERERERAQPRERDRERESTEQQSKNVLANTDPLQTFNPNFHP